MNKLRKQWLMILVAMPLVLSACGSANSNVRVELPQQFRQPQVNIVTMFENRSGRIALIDENGNLVIMDQTGGGIVKITKDASVPSSSATSAQSAPNMAYRWPAWSPDTNQIAFVEIIAEPTVSSRMIEYGADAVVLQHGDGSYVLLQSANGQSAQRPASPSTMVRQPSRVIVEQTTGGNILSSSIYVANTDGKSPLQELYSSTTGGIGYVDWSPDSSQLAFLSQTGDQETTLSLVSKNAGKPRKLATGFTTSWAWHPDGKSIVAKVESNATDNTADLSVLDARADGTLAKVAQQADLPFGAPAFSPDGNTMLITIQEDGKNYLAVADRQGQVQRKLVPFDGLIRFSWSPVGAKVAYVVQPDITTDTTAVNPSTQPGGALHLLDVNSGEDKVLSQIPVIGFFWSPDGVRVAAFSSIQPEDMSASFPGLDLTSNQPSTVLMLQTIDVTTRAYRQLFYFEPTDDFRRLLSQFDRFSRSMNIWSPDSRHLVLPMIYSNTTATYNLIVETEATGSIEPRFVAQGTIAAWSPR